MSVLVIIILGLAAIFLIAFIFFRTFRNWLITRFQYLWNIITYYVPIIWHAIIRRLTIYGIVVLVAVSISFIRVVLAIAIGNPGFTAFAFLTAISLCLIVWFPAGIILRILRVNSAILPPTLKMLVAWTAFVGFVGVLYPEIVTFKVLALASLFGFLSLGVATKINLLDKIIFPLVIAMILVIGWKYFFPEHFRVNTDFAISSSKRLGAWQDRTSRENETQAMATFGRIGEDTEILYIAQIAGDTIQKLDFVDIRLKKDTLVKLFDHKNRVKRYQGQGFIKIQLRNEKKKGTFVNGPVYWIEAYKIRLVTPSELIAEEDPPQPTPAPPAANIILPDTLYPGVHTFIMEAGATSGPKYAMGQLCAKSDNGNQFNLVFPRAGFVPGWTSGSFPNEKDFFIYSLRKQTVTIKVSQ